MGMLLLSFFPDLFPFPPSRFVLIFFFLLPLSSQTLFAEGCRGSCSEELIGKFNLREGKDQQSYGLGKRSAWCFALVSHMCKMQKTLLGYFLRVAFYAVCVRLAAHFLVCAKPMQLISKIHCHIYFLLISPAFTRPI